MHAHTNIRSHLYTYTTHKQMTSAMGWELSSSTKQGMNTLANGKTAKQMGSAS